MRTACRMIFDRFCNGDSSNQPSVYRFNSRFGGGKPHNLIALAGASLYPQLVRQEIDLTPIPAEMTTDGVKLVAFTGERSTLHRVSEERKSLIKKRTSIKRDLGSAKLSLLLDHHQFLR